MPQLDEEKRLKEMKGEAEEEDNRTKISISNQPALKKNPFCITDAYERDSDSSLDKRINYVNVQVLKRCTVITMMGSRNQGQT